MIKKINKKKLLEILENGPFYLIKKRAVGDLSQLYKGWVHNAFNATVISNYGAKLLAVSPITAKKCIVEHIGFYIDIPDYGNEIANVAIYGSLEQAPYVIVRAESACPPSFLFGSQRCNCWDQWTTTRELASIYHQISPIIIESGVELEKYIINYKPDIHKPALVLIYLDSQSGMGSGVLEGKYNNDIGVTAFMRHRGEYTAEQKYNISMAQAFKSIGIEPDPRSLNSNLGYKVSGIILDCLGVRKDIHYLTNNMKKVEALTAMGYSVKRHEIYGRVDVACEIETLDRINEFKHKISYLKINNPVAEARKIAKKIDKIFK